MVLSESTKRNKNNLSKSQKYLNVQSQVYWTTRLGSKLEERRKVYICSLFHMLVFNALIMKNNFVIKQCMIEYGTMIWNISLLHLYRSSRPLVPPTLTPAKWWAAWRPNTRGLSMVWPSQRSGILTTPWAQRSPLKTRSECVFNHWMVFNQGAGLLAWIIMLFITFRLQRDWSWPLTQPSLQTQGKLFIFLQKSFRFGLKPRFVSVHVCVVGSGEIRAVMLCHGGL